MVFCDKRKQLFTKISQIVVLIDDLLHRHYIPLFFSLLRFMSNGRRIQIVPFDKQFEIHFKYIDCLMTCYD